MFLSRVSAVTDFAVSDAVDEVDDEADGDPADELEPGDGWEGEHLGETGEDAEEGNPRDEGDFEGAVVFGVGAAEDPDAEADDGEDEKRRHGDELAEDFDGKEAGENHGNDSGHDGGG